MPASATEREIKEIGRLLEATQQKLLSLPRKAPEREALKAKVEELNEKLAAGAAGLRESHGAQISLLRKWGSELYSGHADHNYEMP